MDLCTVGKTGNLFLPPWMKKGPSSSCELEKEGKFSKAVKGSLPPPPMALGCSGRVSAGLGSGLGSGCSTGETGCCLISDSRRSLCRCTSFGNCCCCG